MVCQQPYRRARAKILRMENGFINSVRFFCCFVLVDAVKYAQEQKRIRAFRKFLVKEVEKERETIYGFW